MPSREITIPDCVGLKEDHKHMTNFWTWKARPLLIPCFFLTIRALFQFKNLRIVYASVMQMQIPEVTDSRLPNHNVK
jgi:hypothetical protein